MSFYLKVPTNKLVHDMTRYIGYFVTRNNDTEVFEVPETETPETFSVFGTKMVRHRFSKDGDTYFMRPKGFNAAWDRTAQGRYASFGVKTEVVKL